MSVDPKPLNSDAAKIQAGIERAKKAKAELERAPKPLSDAELSEIRRDFLTAEGSRSPRETARLLATIDALKADARAAKDRNGPLYRELAALKAEKNVPRSGPTPPDLADSPRAEVGISAGPLADDAELRHLLLMLRTRPDRCDPYTCNKAADEIEQRSAALRAVRELCAQSFEEYSEGKFRMIDADAVERILAAMEIAK